MNEKLNKKVAEIAAIAKKCPENLQEKCFELLLKDFLDTQKSAEARKKPPPAPHVEEPTMDLNKNDSDKSTPKQEEFSEKDLHVKAKRLLNTHGLSVAHINQLFYKEGDKILPLFDDLRTMKASESQLRIAMLQALQNGISSGDFEFDGEEVRQEAQVRKCYDAINFATNFKNNKELFENFKSYKKTSPKIHLSTAGKSVLVEVIQNLQ